MNRFYNGLDRADNDYGYTIGNVVPCCKVCNHWKGTKDIKVFLSHVSKIHKKQGRDKKELKKTQWL